MRRSNGAVGCVCTQVSPTKRIGAPVARTSASTPRAAKILPTSHVRFSNWGKSKLEASPCKPAAPEPAWYQRAKRIRLTRAILFVTFPDVKNLLARSVIGATLLFALSCSSSESDPEGEGQSDLNWLASESPIRISADLVVPAGETLTIEPGVVVEFSGDFTITVEGQLLARGTDAAPIHFTSAKGAEETWGSIVFADGSVDASFENLDEYVDGSIVEWCFFEHAKRALRITAASPFVHQCTFQNNDTGAGLELAGGAGILVEEGASPRIADNVFRDNIANGLAYGGAVYVDQADPILQDNQFINNRSIYGGGVATDRTAAPIVGNHFEGNHGGTEGGGISLISSTSALINNHFEGNSAEADGGGVHVCVTCFPHSNVFIIDNTIVNNTTTSKEPSHAAGGVGAAYLRALSHNNIFGNLRNGEPSDFGWFHELEEGYSSWVANPSIADNWWGTTDESAIAATVFDGQDDERFGVVDVGVVKEQAIAAASPRVTITSRKIRYLDVDEPMPVFLTVYNPGAAKSYELLVLLQYGSAATLLYDGPVDFQSNDRSALRTLPMPENGVYFTELLAPQRPATADIGTGTWHAALYDGDTGERVGDVCSARFELDEGVDVEPSSVVPGVGVTDGGAAVVVGDTYADMAAGLGVPSRTLDLGTLGTYFDYTERHLAGVVTGTTADDTVAALFAGPSFAGQAANGVGIGSTEPDVEAAFGAPEKDPFLQTWWYEEQGVSIEWSEGKVRRINVF